MSLRLTALEFKKNVYRYISHKVNLLFFLNGRSTYILNYFIFFCVMFWLYILN